MQSTLMAQPQQTGQQPLLMIERFLRDRQGIWRQIRFEQGLPRLLRQMLLSSMLTLSCYGAVLGAAHGSLWQILASTVKLPLLYLLTLAICLPALYMFNLLCGGRLSVQQVMALVLGATTVAANLTLAFVPISLFFLITAWNYYLFLLLNVLVLMLTGFIGLYFLLQGVVALNEQPGQAEGQAPALQHGRVNLLMLQIWLALYCLVGTQLSWALRPFFGERDRPFMLFDSLEGSFFQGLIERVNALLG